MLQLEVVDETLSVVAAAQQTLPDEVRGQPELRLPVAMDLVRKMLSNHPFAGRNIVTCLPREMVQVKNLRLPIMPPAEVESAVQFEARNIFPFDIDQAAIRYLPAGEVRQGSDTRLEVIALAAQSQEINTFIEQLHRCGCVIESLDFEPCALYRGIERFIRRREDENEVHVLVDIGTLRSQVIIGKGREISFIKPVEIGAVHLHDAVARKLQITIAEARTLRRRLSDAAETGESSDTVRQAVQDATRSTIEELGREVALCLRYHSVTFRGHKPAKVRVLGAEARDPHLLSILGAVVPIPVEPGRPLSSVNTSRMSHTDRRGSMSEWAVAFGAGLKLTRGYFGARDGKRRDSGPPKRDAAGPAEAVDALQPVEAAPAAAARVGMREAAHA